MQKTSYEMRISDWRSDVCSSDLPSARTARAICSSSALAATFSWSAKEPERGTAAFPSGGITREGAIMAAPLTATAINCSLSTGGRESSTDAMLAVLAAHFKEHGVTVADPFRIAATDNKWCVKTDAGGGAEDGTSRR